MSTRAAQLPDLHIPYAPCCHKEIDRIEEYGNAWLTGYAQGTALAKVSRARAGRIVARTAAPDAPPVILRAYTKFLVWGFWFDDEFIDDVSSTSAEQLPALTSVIDILEGEHGSGAAGPDMENAFHDVVTSLDAAIPDSFGLWRSEMRLWFASMAMQNAIRSAPTAPSVTEYKTMRRYSVCTMPCIVIIDASWGENVPASTYLSDRMTTLRLHAANVVAWQNDVFSFHAERGHPGTFWNLPSVYMAHGFDERGAIEQAALDARRELGAFVKAESASTEHTSHTEAVHIKSLTNWMRGCHDWSLEATRRYIGWRHG